MGARRAAGVRIALAAIVAIAALLRAPCAVPAVCAGDCNGDGNVRIDELIVLVNITLGSAPVNSCPVDDCPDGPPSGIYVDCAVMAVNNALSGCRAATPAPTFVTPCTPTQTFPALPTRTPTTTGSPTRTCASGPPPPTCSSGEGLACEDQQCFAGCRCGTVTATPTPTNTCTPGANPPPGCAYEGSTFTATPLCDRATPTPPTPELSLSVRAVPLPAEHRVAMTADLVHLGGPAVWYLSGCSALCRPALYRVITFEITGPDGGEAIVEYPCAGPYFCAPYLEELTPGASWTQTLSVTGTAWTPSESNFVCFGCTSTALANGHYVVVASFVYRLGGHFSDPVEPALTARAEFDWPPAAMVP